jgi:hypothetical protein
LTVIPSAWVSVWLPRLLRLAFWVRALRQWRFLPGPARTLPVAVILNRFLTDDLVFILGILVSFWFALARPDRAKTASSRGRACPYRPGLADRGGDIAAAAAAGKRGSRPGVLSFFIAALAMSGLPWILGTGGSAGALAAMMYVHTTTLAGAADGRACSVDPVEGLPGW